MKVKIWYVLRGGGGGERWGGESELQSVISTGGLWHCEEIPREVCCERYHDGCPQQHQEWAVQGSAESVEAAAYFNGHVEGVNLVTVLVHYLELDYILYIMHY